MELSDFASNITPDMTAERVHELIYEVAKKHNIKTPQLFKAIYLSLIGKKYGPRLGKMIIAIGVKTVKKILEEHYSPN